MTKCLSSSCKVSAGNYGSPLNSPRGKWRIRKDPQPRYWWGWRIRDDGYDDDDAYGRFSSPLLCLQPNVLISIIFWTKVPSTWPGRWVYDGWAIAHYSGLSAAVDLCTSSPQLSLHNNYIWSSLFFCTTYWTDLFELNLVCDLMNGIWFECSWFQLLVAPFSVINLFMAQVSAELFSTFYN